MVRSRVTLLSRTVAEEDRARYRSRCEALRFRDEQRERAVAEEIARLNLLAAEEGILTAKERSEAERKKLEEKLEEERTKLAAEKLERERSRSSFTFKLW